MYSICEMCFVSHCVAGQVCMGGTKILNTFKNIHLQPQTYYGNVDTITCKFLIFLIFPTIHINPCMFITRDYL